MTRITVIRPQISHTIHARCLMVYFGKVKHGKIETDPGATLPEEAIVWIELVTNANKPGAVPSKPDPFDTLGNVAVDDALPPDFAREHDHYIYGTPKRGQS